MAKNSLNVIARYYNEQDEYSLFVYDEEEDNAMIINTERPSKTESMLDWDGYCAATMELLNATNIVWVASDYVDNFVNELVELEVDELQAFRTIKNLYLFKEIR